MDNQRLKSESPKLSNDCASLKVACEELEQYSRRDCLKLRGIPTSRDKNTDELVIKLASLANISIKKEDISVSHCIGNSSTMGTREMEPAIIVNIIVWLPQQIFLFFIVILEACLQIIKNFL